MQCKINENSGCSRAYNLIGDMIHMQDKRHKVLQKKANKHNPIKSKAMSKGKNYEKSMR